MPEEDKNVVDVAKDIIEKLLVMMGVTASVNLQEDVSIIDNEKEAATLSFNIEGVDLGLLIGRRGKTLACLQYITRLIVGHQIEVWLPIVLDVEGYKQRRYEALRTVALRIAERVKTSKISFTLEPMPAYERRVTHITLADHPDVTTQSIGEGEFRKVVILPRETAD